MSTPIEMAGNPPLKARWIARRNAIFASSRFHYWAARIPLIRSVARGRATRMMDHLVGFSYSQVLRACVESGLLDILANGPVCKSDVAGEIDLSENAALTLLRAARALDLAEEAYEDGWMLGQQGAVLQADPGTQAMIRHHRLLYTDLEDTLGLLRKDRKEPTALSRYWSYAGALHGAAERGEETREYSELMAASQRFVADEVIGAYPFPERGRLLDVGGGHGAFLRRVGEAYPQLELGLFDLPEVVETAREPLAGILGSDRISCHPGNFFEDEIPRGYDMISLVRILHDHDDEPAMALLRNIRNGLEKGGRLLIAEPMAGIPGAEPMGDAFFGLYLWAMGSGRPRTKGEIKSMLHEAGFSKAKSVATAQPVIASCIVANA
ncbi:acetylserotonin O-methyltransferase [Erythrobacter sp. THAF29]|uniref:acetylserotonin O-methyltransferase n=1 Tax=Erythrobacter sp. THAF29 TaxID=2587851 RepID=UPI0012A7AE47|nr:acetylserotonin O-methyltransferase [Erythrobacter sp. THAF29]QFT78622.1 Demethylspheroidene O-methyltransferase [Erythrobacter sp. THAF29]